MNIDDLVSQISKANLAYANGIPFMTDTEYDVLWKALYSLEPDHPILYHTARNPNLSGELINHQKPIFGTNKAFNMPDLIPFMTRFGSEAIIIEPKYDGCAGVLTITKNGYQLVLEGDGLNGINITRHLPKLTIPFEPKNFETVEIIIPWDFWKDSYGANPRNVVAGWLNRKTFPDHYAELVSHNYGRLNYFYSFDGNYENLSELLLSLHYKWSKIYPIDGLLLKVANEKRRLVAGNNGTVNNWSIAWKPPIQTKSTIVTKIEFNVSRLGRVIPTVIYEPIDLCGTTNQRVTGNNARWIIDRNISAGSKIIVGKAGEIIPKIIDVINDENQGQQKSGRGELDGSEKTPVDAFHALFHGEAAFLGSTLHGNEDGLKNENLSVPQSCPVCDYPLVWEGVHLICHGDQCIAKLIRALDYFYSEGGIFLHDLSKGYLERLLYNPECYKVLAKTPWALLDMVSYNIYMPVLETLGDVLGPKIFKNAQKLSGTKNAANFISGLGIAGVGYKTAIKIFNYIHQGKLTVGVSKEAQKNFVTGLIAFERAKKEMKYFKFEPLPDPPKFIFCISGILSITRNDMINLLSKIGGEYSTSVTKQTDYLIIGDSPGQRKSLMARKYNKKIISEDEAKQLFNIFNSGG